MQAGSRQCLHLHGRIDTVECQQCGALSPRAELQGRLAEANRAWAAARSLEHEAASTPNPNPNPNPNPDPDPNPNTLTLTLTLTP